MTLIGLYATEAPCLCAPTLTTRVCCRAEVMDVRFPSVTVLLSSPQRTFLRDFQEKVDLETSLQTSHITTKFIDAQKPAVKICFSLPPSQRLCGGSGPYSLFIYFSKFSFFHIRENLLMSRPNM